MLSAKILCAETLSDQINHFFEPIVAFMAKVIFWDPVAALGFDVGAGIPIVVIWLVFGALFFTFQDEFYQCSWFQACY